MPFGILSPMPTKPIERLLFAQGGNCFFCREPLPTAEASVEHLVAVTNGGSNDDENCVACCKTLNRLLGRMSLKEKLQVILNQKGAFKCPGRSPAGPPAPAAKKAPVPKPQGGPLTRDEQLALVVTDLQKRGNGKPGSGATLINTIRSTLNHKEQPPSDAEFVLELLQARGLVSILEGKVTGYDLPAR
jgi:hypothetical protein